MSHNMAHLFPFSTKIHLSSSKLVNSRMVNSILTNRRSSVRHPIQLSIELELELKNGTTLPVKTINISRSGLQFRCDSWTANKIEPRGIQHHSLDHIDLKIRAKLPLMNENNLHAHGSIEYAQRLSQEEFIIGVKFTDLEESNEKILEQFIELHKKPN